MGNSSREPSARAVQRSLKARSPKMMPSTVGRRLDVLTDICVCARWVGAVMLRTSTSSVVREYRYYPLRRRRDAATGCPKSPCRWTRSWSFCHRLEARLLESARLEALMNQILEWPRTMREPGASMSQRATDTEAKLKHLYDTGRERRHRSDRARRSRTNCRADRHARTRPKAMQSARWRIS